ncbi:hypothetical protein [Pseudomonas aeruginosa]|uniref:hypothetical protein n=1 Tax=Pseudomonas aeruginosa TaxID=287 RepID=UPI00094155F9|nr:hypothetical protein [Pseudomonas aeruginosa]OKS22353.1 hypothetical protein BH607_07770 [Pseudomonas aeruginosa]
MAGLKGLMKGQQLSTEEAVSAFINGASLKANAPVQSAAVFKRVTFSLTEQISEEIDRLSLVPRGFRATRSDVVRAGVAALSAMTEEQVVALLEKVHRD